MLHYSSLFGMGCCKVSVESCRNQHVLISFVSGQGVGVPVEQRLLATNFGKSQIQLKSRSDSAARVFELQRGCCPTVLTRKLPFIQNSCASRAASSVKN